MVPKKPDIASATLRKDKRRCPDCPSFSSTLQRGCTFELNHLQRDSLLATKNARYQDGTSAWRERAPRACGLRGTHADNRFQRSPHRKSARGSDRDDPSHTHARKQRHSGHDVCLDHTRGQARSRNNVANIIMACLEALPACCKSPGMYDTADYSLREITHVQWAGGSPPESAFATPKNIQTEIGSCSRNPKRVQTLQRNEPRHRHGR